MYGFAKKCDGIDLIKWIRGAIKIDFRKNLGFWPNQGGGGLTEAQVFVEIFQKQICLGKWLEMWWNTQYINGGAISHQFMKFFDPPKLFIVPTKKN